jgi:hypothetical protein
MYVVYGSDLGGVGISIRAIDPSTTASVLRRAESKKRAILTTRTGPGGRTTRCTTWRSGWKRGRRHLGSGGPHHFLRHRHRGLGRLLQQHARPTSISPGHSHARSPTTTTWRGAERSPERRHPSPTPMHTGSGTGSDHVSRSASTASAIFSPISIYRGDGWLWLDVVTPHTPFVPPGLGERQRLVTSVAAAVLFGISP